MTIKLKLFLMTCALATGVYANDVKAQTSPTLTFVGIDLTTPYFTTGVDRLAVGNFFWIDGISYAGAYDLIACRAYFLVRNGAVMPNGLTGNSAIRLGNGPDSLLAFDSTFPAIGGAGAATCPNLNPLQGLNHNGFRLDVYGEGGNDTLGGGRRGVTYLYGGEHDDHLESYSGLAVLSGDSGRDELYNNSSSCTMYGGSEPDFLHDSTRDGLQGEQYFGEGGNDCLWDTDGYQKLDCGSGDDRWGGGSGTRIGCDVKATSLSACIAHVRN